MDLTRRKRFAVEWAVRLLFVVLPGVQVAQGQQSASGNFTTVDFPGAAGTIVPPSFTVNLNTKGQFVGEYFNTPTGMVHGFLLDRGVFTTVDFPGSVFTELAGINDAGDIVGNYVDAVSHKVHVLLLRTYGRHHFRREAGEEDQIGEGNFTTIDFPGAVNTFSNSISEEGAIAGGYFDKSFRAHGYVFRNGTFTQIDVPGARGNVALGVNSEDVVVGGYVDAQLQRHGFVLSNGSFTPVDFPGAVASVFACGAPQGGGTVALGINDRGDIVGSYCGTDGNNHGFLLRNGNFLTVDFHRALFTFAGGINSEGQIAGGYRGADGTYHGFVLSTSESGFQIASSATPPHTHESLQASIPKTAANRRRDSGGIGVEHRIRIHCGDDRDAFRIANRRTPQQESAHHTKHGCVDGYHES